MPFNPMSTHMSYSGIGTDYITPSDTVDNLVGVRYVQVVAAGVLCFRMRNGDVSVAVPLGVNQSFGIGRDVVAIHSTGTTPAIEIIAYK